MMTNKILQVSIAFYYLVVHKYDKHWNWHGAPLATQKKCKNHESK